MISKISETADSKFAIPLAIESASGHRLAASVLSDLSDFDLANWRFRAFEAPELGKEPVFRCPACNWHLWPSKRGENNSSGSRARFWKHIGSSTRLKRPACQFSTHSGLSISKLDALVYGGRQEGKAHSDIVHALVEAAKRDPEVDVESVKAGEYLKGLVPEHHGRFPDVFFVLGDRKVALEVQLSPIMLHRIVERELFYERSGVRLLWVTNRFDLTKSKKTWIWDLFAAQGSAAYAFDEAASARAAVLGRMAMNQIRISADKALVSEVITVAEIVAQELTPTWNANFKSRWMAKVGNNWQHPFPRDLVSEAHQYIPASRQNPKKLRVDDAEVICDGIAELVPFSGHGLS